MRIESTVLGAPDPGELADFYQRMLGWERIHDEPDWVKLKPPGGGTGLAFQLEEKHVPPVWPAGDGDQQMMMHLDIWVDDLDEAVRRALEAGATLADFQPQLDNRVMIDPVGHPFCLFES
jgi:catechol 2,3-dioxygenase-like lactoylglutathione lyase family enzyme